MIQSLIVETVVYGATDSLNNNNSNELTMELPESCVLNISVEYFLLAVEMLVNLMRI